MIVIIISLFLLAAVSPFLIRVIKKFYGVFISVSLIPVLFYFLSVTGQITGGRTISHSLEWFRVPEIHFSFYLDGLSLLFAILVVSIGLLIFFYSNEYMHHHEGKGSFFSFMLMFMGSMLGLVLAGNLITLYIFWSLTSLSSFLLIGFSGDAGSRRAAMQALIVTEAGGLAMLAAFILMALVAGTYDIPEIISENSVFRDSNHYTAILLLVFTGAFTKSAQIPFHFWLPEAMKAPTPVSAYLHSAAMVNAGIYLLARLMPVLSQTELWKDVLLITGLITLFFGVYLSLTLSDLKRILAYTTISSLGMMIFLLGIDTPFAVRAAMLYLVVHALLKSCLFMVAGIIDEKKGTRNIYEVGNIFREMKVTAVIALLALLSMAGMPPLLGYIGKEFIYEATLHKGTTGIIITAIALLSNSLMFMISALIAHQLLFRKGTISGTQNGLAGILFTTAPAILAVMGLVLSFSPGWLEPVLKYSVFSAEENLIKVDIKLWHGISKVTILSSVTLAVGFLLFLLRKKLLPAIKRLNSMLLNADLSGLSEKSAGFFLLFSSKFTLLIQCGLLRKYLTIIVLSAGLIIWYMIAGQPINSRQWDFSGIGPLIAGIAFIICLSAISTALQKSKLSAIVTLGATGYGIASIYYLFGAVDVAITQLLIETIILVIFTMVVYRLPQFEELSSKHSMIRDAVFAVVAGSAVTLSILIVLSAPGEVSRISEELTLNSFTEAKGRNVVNVILVDFRALDTLGEISVLLLAAIGVFSLLTAGIKRKET